MKSILIIDDDNDQREFFRLVLEEAGYMVLEAQNGDEGLRCYHQQPCDLVLTDIFMPEKEGIETIIALRKEAPYLKLIAVSGGGRHGSYAGKPGAELALEVAKTFGADRILQKPILADQLLNTIRELLGAND